MSGRYYGKVIIIYDSIENAIPPDLFISHLFNHENVSLLGKEACISGHGFCGKKTHRFTNYPAIPSSSDMYD